MNWEEFFEQEQQQSYFHDLMAFVEGEYAEKTVYPPREQLFSCFRECPFASVRAVILGQDPYIHAHQAHGLCFSVNRGEKIPPSLKNIYKELHDDLGLPVPAHGSLLDWAHQGVLMMNAVMSVEAGKSGSHRKKGWETFTDHAIRFVSDHARPSVFLLWGNWAKEKAALVDDRRHRIIMSAHPSPLSAYHGFFGSRPFFQFPQDLALDRHADSSFSSKTKTGPPKPARNIRAALTALLLLCADRLCAGLISGGRTARR